jgi:hypothetical protein
MRLHGLCRGVSVLALSSDAGSIFACRLTKHVGINVEVRLWVLRRSGGGLRGEAARRRAVAERLVFGAHESLRLDGADAVEVDLPASGQRARDGDRCGCVRRLALGLDADGVSLRNGAESGVVGRGHRAGRP